MDWTERLARAEAVAREAGALALHHFGRRSDLHVEAKRNRQDMVSEADREVETLIRAALSAAFPEDAQLGEEHGLTPGTSGVTWVIDPIDGTAPFLAGLPAWCVSIGAMDAEGPGVGVIFAPVLGEMYAGSRGGGATLNGRRVRVDAEALDLRSGLLGVGANDRATPERVGAMMADLMEAGAGWMRYGSGALMLAWVAAGRLVGYVEPRMSAWDCMAAYCLIEAAGGRTLAFPTGDALTRPAPVMGARADVYEELARITRIEEIAWWEKP